MRSFKYFGLLTAAVVFATASQSLADGVWAWGDNREGQFDNGTQTSSSLPVSLDGVMSSGVTAIATGCYHNLALKADGSVWAWGWNQGGQLGDGTWSNRNSPVAVMGAASGVTAIAAGYEHSLALKADGSVWAWGWNNRYHQLGDGTGINRNSPVAVMSSGVTAIAANGGHSLALKVDGSVWAWGRNGEGQLGNGTWSHQNSPVAVTGAMSSGVTAIAAGVYHSLALKSDGSVWAWGENNGGQLGDGTSINRNSPVAVTGAMSSGVTAISAGNGYSLALKSDGTVWAWGVNYYGQLGNGTTFDSYVPIQVDLLHNIIAIEAGSFSAYALSADGSLWAWGDHKYGQLGLGEDADAFYWTPQQVLPPEGYIFTSISGGGLHTLVTGGSVVPEPTSLGFLATGAAALLLRRRR